MKAAELHDHRHQRYQGEGILIHITLVALLYYRIQTSAAPGPDRLTPELVLTQPKWENSK